MRADLVMGLVHRGQRRTGKLELPAGLKADDAALGAIAAAEGDDIALFDDGRIPVEAFKTFEKRADAPFAGVGDRHIVALAEDELFMLGADAPIGFRLRASLEVSDEFVPRLDDRAGKPIQAYRHY